MPDNSMKARLKKLEKQVQRLTPSPPGKAEDWHYLMVDRDQYEAAMAMVSTRFGPGPDGTGVRSESPAQTVPAAARAYKPSEPHREAPSQGSPEISDGLRLRKLRNRSDDRDFENVRNEYMGLDIHDPIPNDY